MIKLLCFNLAMQVLFIVVMSGPVFATAAVVEDDAAGDTPVIDMQPWTPDMDAGLFAFELPNKLIDQHGSPDRQYTAQLLYARPGPVYYLAIIDRKLGHRYFLDERLIIGDQYPNKLMRVYWKDADTIVIRARNAIASHDLFINYNMKTGHITQGILALSPGPPVRDKLAPADLKPVVLLTLDDRMLLHRQIPIGVTYAALKQSLPQLGIQKTDAGAGLTEAFLDIDVLDHKARVEFNFSNHVLYNFYYHMDLDSAAEDGKAYKALQDYYSEHYGEFKEENVRESEHYAVESSHWHTREVDVSVVNNITPGSYNISWALQQ